MPLYCARIRIPPDFVASGAGFALAWRVTGPSSARHAEHRSGLFAAAC
jgi:hypothetical protein